MATVRTHSVALTGLDGHLVEIEAEAGAGLTGLALSGLPETSLRETRDRVRAAIINSGEPWPEGQLAVTVAPAVRSGQGSSFDLAIAAAILAAAGRVRCLPHGHVVFLGELGLDGALRPVRGVLPAVGAAAAAGFAEVIVPDGNAAEAALASGIHVTGAPSLTAVVRRLRMGGDTAALQTAGTFRPSLVRSVSGPAAIRPDLADLTCPQPVKQAAEICAAGGHHLLLTGPFDGDKALFTERLHGLMPALEPTAALEVTAVHSLAGTLPPGGPMISRPPLCSPHHSASRAAIIGGGAGPMRPGTASLAHHGVLFLDEAPEFDCDVLDALRQPLECGRVVLARGGVTVEFPADFTLVLTASPCPCVRTAASGEECSCTPMMRRRYRARLAGLLDRVDVTTCLRPAERALQPGLLDPAEPSSVVAARVAAARQRAARRLAGTPWRLNARVRGAEMRRRFPATPSGMTRIERAVDLGQISAFAADRVLALAWTLADLAGNPQPGVDEVAHALWLRLGPDA
jgi:magnesium chelatase family protein